MVKKIAIALLIPVSVLLLNFNILLNEMQFYEKEFEKNNVYNSVDKEAVLAITANLLGYLTGRSKLNAENFTTREILHFEDLQRMFRNLNMALYFSVLAILFLYCRGKQSWLKGVMYGSVVTIVIVLAAAMLNFEWFFLKFHIVVFTNDYWLLSPETTSITLFPLDFFHDFFKTLLLRSFVMAMAFIVLAAKKFKNTKP